jgi:predicted nucleic acid-binding protein
MIKRILDSVILMDHLNGIEKSTKFILGLDPDEVAISVITRAEILVGVEGTSEGQVRAFLDQYHLLIIDKTTADLAGSLRKRHGWKLPDAFQAALALLTDVNYFSRQRQL